MPRERAYHKLGAVEDFEAIQRNGFRISQPAASHWLGEGVYFFLDPNGVYWSTRWPFDQNNPRTNSHLGIISTDIDTSKAVDLRKVEMMRSIRNIVIRIKLAISLREKRPYVSDGEAFHILVASGGVFEKVYKFLPQVLIANFDVDLKPYRLTNSRTLLTDEVDQALMASVSPNSQIQACVRDLAVIGILQMHYP